MENLFLKLISLGSLFIFLLIIVFLIYLLFGKQALYSNLLKKFGLQAIFVFSLFAMIGSLLMSLFFSFPPCDLCWYQRLFMYPITFISGIALYRKEYKIGAIYSIVFAVIGAIIAVYHYILQFADLFSKDASLFCSPITGDCSSPDFIEFGFVTTPLISLSIFLFVIICSIYVSKKD